VADFFELQDRARSKTRTLVFYFLIAVVLIVIAINIAAWFSGQMAGMFDMPLTAWPYYSYSWLTTAIVLLVIILASVIQSARLSGGGTAVAKMVNGRHIKQTSKDTLERRLLNVVEEMSIASGMPMPTVYVMDEEQGINAFVAGLKPSLTVLVVTRGCLEKLSRDELQGVIGHEYSHIFNADMRTNVRLIGMLAGILFIGQMGYFLMRILGRTGAGFSGSRRSKNSGGNMLLFVLILGVTLFAIGYIGLFFGRLIKASISRQREYLADASSVQFTRDVDGIADALIRIQQDSNHGLLQNSHAEDMSHMCFEMPIKMSFGGLLATHPPIKDRVRALKPNYIFSKQTTTAHNRKSPGQGPAATQNFANSAGFATDSDANFNATPTTQPIQSKPMSSALLMASIGNPKEHNLQAASQIMEKIPAQIWAQSCEDIQSAKILFFSLLVHAESEDWDSLKTYFQTTLDAQDFVTLNDWVNALLSLKGWIRLPLFNHVVPTLQAMQENEKNDFFKQMLHIIKNNKRINLSEYLLYALAKLRLTNEKKRPRINSLKKIKTEIEYLFVTLVHSAHADPKTAQRQYQNIIGQFAFGEVAKINQDEFDPVILHNALLQISQLSPLLQKSVIQAMTDCVLWDNEISVDEYELVRTVCDYLDTPVPVLT